VTAPFFSIIIPTFNRPRDLRRCIDAISRSQFDRDQFEIIVVNDGGDPLQIDVELANSSTSVRVVSQSNRGPASARNLGSSLARGQFLCFVDDDCLPDKQWLSRMAASVEIAPNSMHGGRTINLLHQNYCSAASQSLIDYMYSYYNSSTTHARNFFFASNNIVLSSKLFAEVGGFDEAFTSAEDRDFCRTWHSKGWDVRYVPDAIMYHAHDLSLRTFHRQHFNYGRGALPYWKKGAAIGSHRFRVEPLSFYTGMFRHAFSQGVEKPIVITSLILLSQVANAAGFAYEAIRSGRRVEIGFGSAGSMRAAADATTLSAEGHEITRSAADWA
jgi:GT2 family glycosyltransferase